MTKLASAYTFMGSLKDGSDRKVYRVASKNWSGFNRYFIAPAYSYIDTEGNPTGLRETNVTVLKRYQELGHLHVEEG